MKYSIAFIILCWGAAVILAILNDIYLGCYRSNKKWKNFLLKSLPIILFISGMFTLMGCLIAYVLHG